MRNFLLLAVFVALTSCAATGPLSGPALAGAAAMVAVFDQLLAGGVIDPLQHQTLVQGLGAVQTTVEAVQKVQENTITVGEGATAAGGLTAAILAGIRVWRGKATKAA